MLYNNDDDVNPMGRLYNTFIDILQNITIKYVYKAKEFETLETKQAADGYFLSKNKRDVFETYNDYTSQELDEAGVRVDPDSYNIYKEVGLGNVDYIPKTYRQTLLKIRRRRVIENFEEKNNYYRRLNGMPDIEDKYYYYADESLANAYGFDNTIPIHLIQDYYNNQDAGLGNYYIQAIETSGLIKRLQETHPDKEYLNFIGSNRIDLELARKAKNFELIQFKYKDMKESLRQEFIMLYEACRSYFMKVIYMPEFRNFLQYYDNFIGMSIMLMTFQQLIIRQIPLSVKREFFDIYAVKALYEAYDIPYNLYLDEDTNSAIVQNLNLLIQNKATNKVFYDIANLLGFPNISIYKYYLAKERRYDLYGVPIVEWIEKFNNDTGEYEMVPDYEKMYDVYFMREELRNNDFIHTFDDPSNRVDYDKLTHPDPFWYEDSDLYKKVWESEYNFVEAKYLGLGIAYSMTEILFEDVLLLKVLLQKGKEIDGITVKLPKITGNLDIPLFDVIVALVCLTACKHNLYGEIISIPAEVIHVLDEDYNINDTEEPDVDTLGGDFNHYFFDDDRKYFIPDKDGNPVTLEDAEKAVYDYLSGTDKPEYEQYILDAFSFDFDLASSPEFQNSEFLTLKKMLGEEDALQFLKYLSILEISGSVEEKIEALNLMYRNIRDLYRFLNLKMTNTSDRKTYQHLKHLYDTLYYAKEMDDIFRIYLPDGSSRAAKNYFEFLYYHNPVLYDGLFDFDIQKAYQQYLEDNGLTILDFKLDQFTEMVYSGEYIPRYDILKDAEVDDVSIKDEKIYTYVNHILSRLESILQDINFMQLLNDSATPVQELLEKLLRFFKSFTVDMVEMDTIFVCDLKSENLLRFFEEVHYIEKWIVPREDFRLSYSDAINHIFSRFYINERSFQMHDLIRQYGLTKILETKNNATYMHPIFVYFNDDYTEITDIEGNPLTPTKDYLYYDLSHPYSDKYLDMVDVATNGYRLYMWDGRKFIPYVERFGEFRRHTEFATISEDRLTATYIDNEGNVKDVVPDCYHIYLCMPKKEYEIYTDLKDAEELHVMIDEPGFNECYLDTDKPGVRFPIEPNSHTIYVYKGENYYWNGVFFTRLPVFEYVPYIWDGEKYVIMRMQDMITNSIRLYDTISKTLITKEEEVKDNMELYDAYHHMEKTRYVYDNFKLQDKIVKMWLSEPKS